MYLENTVYLNLIIKLSTNLFYYYWVIKKHIKHLNYCLLLIICLVLLGLMNSVIEYKMEIQSRIYRME